mmetsp:Transcript_145723/g.254349  ORF Transcript_145723/g.254349 Transcript_145723/m.254349 type:complete len:689 (+) Transcript_145723:4299-6365(+)
MRRLQFVPGHLLVLLLCLLKLRLGVGLLLLDVDEEGVADEATVGLHAGHGFLELVDNLLHLAGVLAAIPYEVLHDPLGGPEELVQARGELLVQRHDALREEAPLVGGQQVDNVVVVAHDEAHVLPEDAQPLLLGHHVHRRRGEREAEAVPVAHLLEHSEEVQVEVALQHHDPIRAWDLGDEIDLQQRVQALGDARPPFIVEVADVLLQRTVEALVGGVRLLLLLGVRQEVAQLQEPLVGLDAVAEVGRPDGPPDARWVERLDGRLLLAVPEHLLDVVQLLVEEDVHLDGLALDRPPDVLALGQEREGLQELHAGLDRADDLEGGGDDVGHHHLKVLGPVLIHPEVPVPQRSRLDVQDVVLQVPQDVHLLLEGLLDVDERLGDLRAAGAPEARDRGLVAPGAGRLPPELDLPLADLQKVLAALLDEGVDLRKNAGLVNLPRLAIVGLAVALGGGRQHLLAHLLPLLTRRHTVLQGHHAGLHVAVEDCLQADLPAAAHNDLVGDLAQHPHQALRDVVELGVVEDHLHGAQDLREQHRDPFHRARAQVFAGGLDRLQVLEVVNGLVRAFLDQRGQLVEGFKVVQRLGILQHPHDGLHILPLQLIADVVEVLRPCPPELNLSQGALIFGGLHVVLFVQHILDLPRPVDEGGLKPLHPILVLSCPFNVLLWHIEDGAALHSVDVFRQPGKEPV